MASKPIDFTSLKTPEKLRLLSQTYNLDEDEVAALSGRGGLDIDSADIMSENVIGLVSRPLYIVEGLIVNGKEYMVPLATEQKTVISKMRRGVELSKHSGGFTARNTGSRMIGQIQVLGVYDIPKAMKQVQLHQEEIMNIANTLSDYRKAIDVRIRSLETMVGTMLLVELVVDVKDSMGANIVDAMCETVSPLISSLSGGVVNVRVISNLASERLVQIDVALDVDIIGGIEVARDIVYASYLAEFDPYAAVTHNKSIMNGVSSVLLATSNDTRAVEAGAHAFAALSGKYNPLLKWRLREGVLFGELVMPMAVGLVGGSISVHPTAKASLKILGVETAAEFGEVIAASGLACNLGTLHSLVVNET